MARSCAVDFAAKVAATVILLFVSPGCERIVAPVYSRPSPAGQPARAPTPLTPAALMADARTLSPAVGGQAKTARLAVFVPQYRVDWKAIDSLVGRPGPPDLAQLASLLGGRVRRSSGGITVIEPGYLLDRSPEDLHKTVQFEQATRSIPAQIISAIPPSLRQSAIYPGLMPLSELSPAQLDRMGQIQGGRGVRFLEGHFGKNPGGDGNVIQFIPNLTLSIGYGIQNLTYTDLWLKPSQIKHGGRPEWYPDLTLEAAKSLDAKAREQRSVLDLGRDGNQVVQAPTSVVAVKDLVALARPLLKRWEVSVDPRVADRLVVLTPGQYRVGDLIDLLVPTATLKLTVLGRALHIAPDDEHVNLESIYAELDAAEPDVWRDASVTLEQNERAPNSVRPFAIDDFARFRDIAYPDLTGPEKAFVDAALRSSGITLSPGDYANIHVTPRIGLAVLTYSGKEHPEYHGSLGEVSFLYTDLGMR